MTHEEMLQQASQRPWKSVWLDRGLGHGTHIICDANLKPIDVNDPVAIDLIITAVNSFEALTDALEMVRDADEDCKRDGLPTIPSAARFKIDAALKLAGI